MVFQRVSDVYGELCNLYSFVYCIFVCVLSFYAISFNQYAQTFSIIMSSTFYYMSLTIFRYAIEYMLGKEYIEKAKSIANDLEKKDECAKLNKLGKVFKSRAIEYIFHHLLALSVFNFIPNDQQNIEFCMREYTKFHLFEVSTIPLTITASPILKRLFFVTDNNVRYWYFLFAIIFFAIRIVWILPSSTMEFYNHYPSTEFFWFTSLCIVLLTFWALHVVWLYKLVRKTIKEINKMRISNKKKIE